ncbi:MAG: rRNA maturation RNase YbeY [Patescibacteria group bacterium]
MTPRVDLVFRNEARVVGFPASFFQALIGQTLSACGVSGPRGISVSLVARERMRVLNKEHRNVDAVTDVLSFPLGDGPENAYTTPVLGDLFMCVSYIRAAAKEKNIPIRRMLAWATIHGTLHLLGYDHERSRKEASTMEELEERILTAL